MSLARRLAAALVHFPVLDREGNAVTAAMTSIDLHDISRSAYTYGLEALYIVHPIAAQRELANRIREHWVNGSGGLRIPDRVAPLSQLRIVPSLDDALADFAHGGTAPELWTTSAEAVAGHVTLAEARARLEAAGPAVLVAFGTSWGLAPAVHSRAAARLEPLRSPREDGYNHLSVRAAAAILFDRLLGSSGSGVG